MNWDPELNVLKVLDLPAIVIIDVSCQRFYFCSATNQQSPFHRFIHWKLFRKSFQVFTFDTYLWLGYAKIYALYQQLLENIRLRLNPIVTYNVLIKLFDFSIIFNVDFVINLCQRRGTSVVFFESAYSVLLRHVGPLITGTTPQGPDKMFFLSCMSYHYKAN